MLERYFVRPQTVDRIRASWIGSEIETYVGWLIEHGYSARCVFRRVPLIMRFGAFASKRGAVRFADLPCHVEAFVRSQVRRRGRRDESTPARKGFAREQKGPIEHFLDVVMPPATRRPAESSYPFDSWAPGFLAHLRDERGLSGTTIKGYAGHLAGFQRHLDARGTRKPHALSPAHLEDFLAERRAQVSARSMGPICAALRRFLQYLFREHVIPRDLSRAVGSPKTYRFSDVPRSISEEDVQRTLSVIDRRTVSGRRDHAMLLLLVVYGLRAREVAALTLDDFDWRANTLHVRTRKGGHEAIYPLAAEIGQAVLAYLRDGRPETSDRRLFFRIPAPRSPVNHQIVSSRAKVHLQSAGVQVERPGSHTLRHSCAQRLVDADFSLKVIGDYLGHRTPSSTRVYSKVSVEALREVALGDGEAIL